MQIIRPTGIGLTPTYCWPLIRRRSVTSASGSSDSPRRRGDSRTPDDLPGRLLGMCQRLSSITWGPSLSTS
jgi:hypothetical protein